LSLRKVFAVRGWCRQRRAHRGRAFHCKRSSPDQSGLLLNTLLRPMVLIDTKKSLCNYVTVFIRRIYRGRTWLSRRRGLPKTNCCA
jgi:hypothetical protein